MASYTVGFPSESVQKHFEKELAGLDEKPLIRIQDALEGLAENPRPPGKKFRFLKPPVTVYQYVASHRLRVGDYRILYDVDDTSRRVILLAIRRRTGRTYR